MDDGRWIGVLDELRRRGKGEGLLGLRVRDGAQKRRRRLELDLREEGAETLSELRVDERELRADRLGDRRRGAGDGRHKDVIGARRTCLDRGGQTADASEGEARQCPSESGL